MLFEYMAYKFAGLEKGEKRKVKSKALKKITMMVLFYSSSGKNAKNFDDVLIGKFCFIFSASSVTDLVAQRYITIYWGL